MSLHSPREIITHVAVYLTTISEQENDINIYVHIYVYILLS